MFYNRCQECPLNGGPRVHGQLGTKNQIVFIGEAPGYDEVAQGVPFVGRAGKLLDGIFAELGIDRKELYISNSCICHPIDDNGKNRRPTIEEIACCNDRLVESIKRINPKVVVALGAVALYALVEPKPLDVIRMRDYIGIEQKSKNGYLVIPTYHPSYLLRSGEARGIAVEHIRIAYGMAQG